MKGEDVKLFGEDHLSEELFDPIYVVILRVTRAIRDETPDANQDLPMKSS
jgi:hypothetical protein